MAKSPGTPNKILVEIAAPPLASNYEDEYSTSGPDKLG
jgi:hypothetical protein